MMTERAYVKGADFPALPADRIRLYSMRLCPYAQRTRLVLLHKKIPHEIININLRRKPLWLWNRNPKGLVPVLEKDGVVVYESRDCNDYLEDKYPDYNLTPTDPTIRRLHEQLMDKCDNELIPRFYMVVRASAEQKLEKLEMMFDTLNVFERQLTGSYFGGERPSMLDFYIWPWLERLTSVEEFTGFRFPPRDRFPRLHAHVQMMYTQPEVQQTMLPGEYHYSFSKALSEGNPDYDIGLSKL